MVLHHELLCTVATARCMELYASPEHVYCANDFSGLGILSYVFV